MPNVSTAQARVRVAAVGDVFFDVPNPSCIAAYDFNNDSIINTIDLGYVQKRLPRGAVCAPRVRGG